MNTQTQPEDSFTFPPLGSDVQGIADYYFSKAHRALGTVMVARPGTNWTTLTRLDLELTGDDPEDATEFERWCVLFDGLFECDPTTAVLFHFDLSRGKEMVVAIDGPSQDHRTAIRTVSRALGLIEGIPPITAMPGFDEALAPTKVIPKADNDNRNYFETIDAETLLGMEFSPINYVIPGFVAEGLTLLGGRPKLGKSWLALDFGIAVASGGQSLGVNCEQGDALYLALEDNQRRLKDRLKIVLPKFERPNMSRLSLLTEAPKIGAGLIELLEEWRLSASSPRLIIVDTLAIVRPPKGKNQDSYSADYEALSPLQKFAGAHRLAVVVVTHVRKAEAEDPLEMISGTNGLTGAADSILILNRTKDGSKLYGRGRDVEEVEKALEFDGGRWTVLGDPVDVKRSHERKQIMAALAESGKPMAPAAIAEVTGMKPQNVSYLLGRMLEAGEAVKGPGYGTYVSPPISPRSPISSHSHYPPSSVERDTESDGDLKGLKDLKGGTVGRRMLTKFPKAAS